MASPRQSPRTAVHSPRRSPRLSTGKSGNVIDSLQQSAEERRQRQESPLTSRHAIGNSASASLMSRRSLSPSKQRVTTRPALDDGSQAGPSKVARRAYSVGGARHTLSVMASTASTDEENEPFMQSRRNVPGPRKSAIRTGPPQVFASPTEVSPPPGIRPLAARLSNGIEAIGGPDLKNLMESIGFLRSPKGKERHSAEPDQSDHTVPPRRIKELSSMSRASSVPSALDGDDATILRKRRRVTFNPFQENANFEKDEPTIHIYPTGEAIPLPETSVSTTSDMSIASTSSSSASSGEQSEDAISFENRENGDDEGGNNGRHDDDREADGDSSEEEVEDEITGAHESRETGAGATASSNDDSTMDMTQGYGGVNDSTAFHGQSEDQHSELSSDMDIEDSAMDIEAPNVSRAQDETVTMQFTSVYGRANTTPTHPRLAQLRSFSDDEDESSIDQELLSLPRLDSPAPEAQDATTPIESEVVDDNSSAMDMTDIVGSRSSPQRMSSSPQKAVSPASSPRRSPRKSISHIDSLTSETPDGNSRTGQAKDSSRQLQESPRRSQRVHDTETREGKPEAFLAASPRKENSLAEDVFGPKATTGSRPSTPSARKSTASSPRPASQSGHRPSSPSKIAASSSPRRSLHEISTNSSPRLGHEYCKIPAEDAPKPRLSAATLKMQARRELQAQVIATTGTMTPSKSLSRTRASIGRHPVSPAKSPFKARASQKSSTQSPVKDMTHEEAGAQTTKQPIRKSLAPPIVLDPIAESDLTASARILERAATPTSPRRRPSSPLRPPGTPSRAWQSFREGQSPMTPKSPARRIPLSRAPTPNKQIATFGTPQRLNSDASTDRIAAGRTLSLTNKSTPSRRSALQDASAINNSTTTQIANNDGVDGINMKQFFENLNMGFLDLSAPTRRRLSPPAFNADRIANTSSIIRAACATVPFLDSINDACRELKASVDDGRQLLTEHERDFFETPPSYVAEVMAMSSSAEKAKATASFKLQKNAARAIAQKAYYGWRTDKQFDAAALEQLKSIRNTLLSDLEGARQRAKTLSTGALPALRRRHEELSAELEKARARQQSIDDWNNEEMRAMHAAMEEQGSILEQQRASHAEGADQLQRLRTRLEELNTRKASAETAIAEARATSVASSGATRAEAARLARHIGHLEALHLWSLHKAEADRIHLVLDSRLNVVLDIEANELSASKSAAWVKAARVHLLQQRDCSEGMHVATSVLQEALIDVAASQLRPAEIIRFIGMTWTRARHVDNVARRLELQYPVQLEASADALTMKACILLPHARTKVALRLLARASALMDPRADLFAVRDVAVSRIYCSHRGKDVAALLLANVQSQLSSRNTSSHQVDVANAVVTAVKALQSATAR